MDSTAIAAVGICLIVPTIARALDRRGQLPSWLTPIILCYAIGIVIGNLRLLPGQEELLETVAGGAMVVALPLLLFTVRLPEIWRYGRPMLGSFAVCCGAVFVGTTVAALLFQPDIADG